MVAEGAEGNMNDLDPATLTGPRAYYTGFDPRIISRPRGAPSVTDVHRQMKLLLLIKSRIVCAASHLGTEHAYLAFRECPRLLTEGHVVPALRKDKEDIAAAVRADDLSIQADIAAFYAEHVSTAVRWELEENSGWFRDRFLAELDNETSLVRRQLSRVGGSDATEVVRLAAAKPILSRAAIEDVARRLPDAARDVIIAFRDLVYHVSGARVVQCESALPQENYIDFDLADLSQKRTKLSEAQVLWKLFFELAFDTIHRRLVPLELLDLLSFEDILTIREPLLDASFQKDYDRLVASAVASVLETRDAEKGMVLDVSELEAIRGRLANVMKEVLEREMRRFLLKRAKADVKTVGSVGASIALGVAGCIPVVGMVASAVSVAKDTPALVTNVTHTLRSYSAASSVDSYLKERQRCLTEAIQRVEHTGSSPMLDAVELLTAAMAEKIRL